MYRKCKLKKYYEELKHLERQVPGSYIPVSYVILRIKEIREQIDKNQ